MGVHGGTIGRRTVECNNEDLRPCSARLCALLLPGMPMWLGTFIQLTTGVILSNKSIS